MGEIQSVWERFDSERLREFWNVWEIFGAFGRVLERLGILESFGCLGAFGCFGAFGRVSKRLGEFSLLGPSLCPEGNARTWTRDHREISGRTEVLMYALICCCEH